MREGPSATREGPLGRRHLVATRFGFVSTYPPTLCGLATFTAALFAELTSSGVDDGRVVRLLDAPAANGRAEVLSDIVSGDLAGTVRAAARLNDCDVVIVQHEFGVYGGPDGQDVVALLAEITVPTIVVLHTVPAHPTPHQRQVLEAVVGAASAVVTMTRAARDRLVAGFRVDAGKVSIIAHGAPDPASSPTSSAAVVSRWTAHDSDLGTAGSRQGNRVGDPGDGPASRHPPAAQIHRRRPNPSEGGHFARARHIATACGQLIDSSRWPMRSRWTAGTATPWISRDLVASADVVLLPYDTPRPGHLGCPERGRCGRQTGRRDSISRMPSNYSAAGPAWWLPIGTPRDRRRAPSGHHSAERRCRDVGCRGGGRALRAMAHRRRPVPAARRPPDRGRRCRCGVSVLP